MTIERLIPALVALPPRGGNSIALQWAVAGLAGGSGVLCLIPRSWLRADIESIINVHVLFLLLLAGLLLSRLHARTRNLPMLRAREVVDCSRELSRMVYLMLYAVIGVRQVVGIAHSLWVGGPLDFNLFDAGHRGPDLDGFNLQDDFQALVASGIVALVLIRVVAYGTWVRLSARLSSGTAAGTNDGNVRPDPAPRAPE